MNNDNSISADLVHYKKLILKRTNYQDDDEDAEMEHHISQMYV